MGSIEYLRKLEEIYDQVVTKDDIAKLTESLRIFSPMSVAAKVDEKINHSLFGSSSIKKSSAF